MQFENFCLDESSAIVYISDFLIEEEASQFYNFFVQDLQWQQEKIKIYGKEFWQPRLLAWYADSGISYKYSGIVHEPFSWTDQLLKMKNLVEAAAATKFNSVLANYYRNGSDSMGWHSDDEKELGKEPMIASVSLGAVRKFSFRPKKGREGKKISFELNSGSLLIMKGKTQEHFQHAVPKTAKPVEGRINLTFRKIFKDER